MSARDFVSVLLGGVAAVSVVLGVMSLVLKEPQAPIWFAVAALYTIASRMP